MPLVRFTYSDVLLRATWPRCGSPSAYLDPSSASNSVLELLFSLQGGARSLGDESRQIGRCVHRGMCRDSCRTLKWCHICRVKAGNMEWHVIWNFVKFR